MAEKRDYYQVLGVNRDATDAEIKSEYRKKAKKYHPDLNPGDAEAEAKFKELGEAYEVLSNKEKRARYDQYGHAGVDPSFGAGGGAGGFEMDLGDLFGSFFGGGFGDFGGGARRRDPNAPKRGDDVHTGVSITFMEAAKGCKKTISIEVSESCARCGGSGASDPESIRTCPTCGGSGYVTVQQKGLFGSMMRTTRPCSECGGRGKIVDKPCRECGGSGSVRRKRRLEIEIPAGINDDQSLSLRGRGNAGANGGPAGDVIVTVSVRPDQLFERRQYDVFVQVPVKLSEAALGCEITVPSVDGRLKFKVPEGTQSGSTFRLRGKGIQYLNGRGRGDQYVEVVVETPKHLTRELKQKLEEIDRLLGDKQCEKQKQYREQMRRTFGKE